MIALNIHRPEAHLEIRGSDAVGLLVCYFVFTLTKLPEKQNTTKHPVYIFCWVVRRKDQGAEGLPGGLCSEKSRPLEHLSVWLGGSALSAQKQLCVSYGGNRAFSVEKYPHDDVSHAGLKTSCKMSLWP